MIWEVDRNRAALRCARAILVATLALALTAALALVPRAAAAASPELEVLGGKDSRTVQFGFCPSKAQVEEEARLSPAAGCNEQGDADPYLGGEVTLRLKLDPSTAPPEARDPDLTAKFVPESRGARQLLCAKDTTRVLIDGTPPRKGCSFAARKISEGKVFSLALGFKLPIGQAVSLIEGNLVFELDGEKLDEAIPVDGAVRELQKVEVNPASVTLDSEDPTAEVRLVGPGVVQLLRAGLLGNTSVPLRDDAGDTTTATVEFQSAEEVERGSNPDLARGVVRLDHNPSPGAYKGKLPVSHAGSDAPSIEIELKAHRSPWVLVLLVFAGIIGVGLVTRLVTLATRRGLLLEALRQSVEAYRCIRESSKGLRAWDLEDLIRLYECDEASVSFGKRARRWGEDLIGISRKRYPGARLQGVPALEKSIKQARSSVDLDEDADRTLDTIARIQRWLRAEPAAWQLQLVEESLAPAPLKRKKEKGGPLEWRSSRAQLETLALLEAAKREPADAEEADALVASLLWQAKFHHDLAELWRVSEDKEESDLVKKLVALDAKMSAEGAKGDGRTPAARDALDAELRSLRPKDWKPGEMTHPDEPAGCAASDSTPGEIGITPVAWTASPNLFTGWATLDKPSYGQLTLRAATSSRSVYRRYGLGEMLLIEARSLRPADLLMSLAILSGAAGAYGLSKYGHTWGSCEDMIAAFLAGATGAAAVKWGALPIFRSQRIRSSKAA